jgi:hypothetical protein
VAKDPAEADSAQEQATEFRKTLQDAFSFIEGQKITQSFSALTPEDCFDRYIERIEGKDTTARPNVLNRIAKVRNEVLASIEKIKAMPPEAFREARSDEDVNTAR